MQGEEGRREQMGEGRSKEEWRRTDLQRVPVLEISGKASSNSSLYVKSFTTFEDTVRIVAYDITCKLIKKNNCTSSVCCIVA